MVSVVRIAHTGAPEVMTIEQVTAREPGPGEVWLEQEAIGVNFLDVSQRKGRLGPTLQIHQAPRPLKRDSSLMPTFVASELARAGLRSGPKI